MREGASVSFSYRGNGLRAQRFRGKSRIASPRVRDEAEGERGSAETSGFAVADQRKMPHRRHRAALGEADAAMRCGPLLQTRPWKFRPPAEPPRQRRERQFEDAARATLGADVIDQNEFPAGF